MFKRTKILCIPVVFIMLLSVTVVPTIASNSSSNDIKTNNNYKKTMMNFTTINTKYGLLHVENNTFKNKSKEQLISDLSEFVYLQKMARITNNFSNNELYTSNIVLNETNLIQSPSILQSTEYTKVWNMERSWFIDPSASSHKPYLIWGHFKINPLDSQYVQHWDQVYEQREILLNNNDGIEFIVTYNPDTGKTVDLSWAVYDGTASTSTDPKFAPPDQVGHAVTTDSMGFDYELKISSNTYNMWWSDFDTNQYWTWDYIDQTPSGYIYEYLGSSEFMMDINGEPLPFNATTEVWDYYTKYVGDGPYTYRNIGQTFTSDGYSQDLKYVYSRSNRFNNNWYTHSYLMIGYPNPT